MIDAETRGRVLALLPLPGPVEDDEVEVRALIYALEEFRRYNKNQLRIPEGFEGGGRFRSLATQLIRLLKDWSEGKGDDDPLDTFTDDQLRKVAAAQGLVGKGERLGPNRRNVLKKRLYEAAMGGKTGDAGEDKPVAKKAAPVAKKTAPTKKVAPTKKAAPNATPTVEPLSGEEALEAAPYRLEGRGPESSQGVSREQMDKTLARYAGFSHGEINHDLRIKGDGPVPPRSRKMVKEIDAAMASSQLTDDIAVIRMVGAKPDAFGGVWKKNMTGVEFHDAGFASTSANPDLQQVPSYRSTTAVVMHIRAPKGTHAITMSRPDDETGEMEILLDRGLAYRITGDRSVNGQRHFDVEVFGASAKKAAAPTKQVPAKATPKSEALSDDPAVREVQVENKIRAAYLELQRRPGDWVPLADLREKLTDVDRAEVDKALTSMAVQPGHHVISWDNRKALTKRDREASVRIGGDETHAVRIEDTRPRPLPGEGKPKAPAKKAVPKAKGSDTGAPGASDIEAVASMKDLTGEQIARGEHLTPAGRKALDALGPAGHPKLAAIPDTEGKIREGYRILAVPGVGRDHQVSLADLRKLIGEQVSRSELDTTLKNMALRGDGDVSLTPQSYARENSATRIPAAVMMGGQEQNMLHIDDPTLARPSEFAAVAMAEELLDRRAGRTGDPMMALIPDADLKAEIDRRQAKDAFVARELVDLPGWPPAGKPKALAKKATPAGADLKSRIEEAKTRDEAAVLLAGLKNQEIAAFAADNDLPLSSRTKQAMIDDIVDMLIGGRLSREAFKDLGQPASPDLPDKPYTGGDELDGMTKAKLLATHGGKGSRIHSGMSKPEMIAAIRQWRAGEPERAAKRAVNARENEPYIRHLEGVRGQLPDRNYGRAVDEILEKMRSGEYDRWDAYNHAGTSKVMTGPGANSPETIQGRRVMDDFRRLVAASEDTDEPLGGTIKGEPTTAEQLAKKTAEEAAEDVVKHTVADLRLIAKQRGVKIPAGTKKAELLALLGLTRSDFTDWEERMADEPVDDEPLPVEIRDRAIAAFELRIAGKDITPGHDELHHYWTRGKGLAKWLGHLHEWTALYHHLLKYAPNPEAAKRWASAWFHEVKGFWPGADLHRVEHGKPPRGKRIGPG